MTKTPPSPCGPSRQGPTAESRHGPGSAAGVEDQPGVGASLHRRFLVVPPLRAFLNGRFLPQAGKDTGSPRSSSGRFMRAVCRPRCCPWSLFRLVAKESGPLVSARRGGQSSKAATASRTQIHNTINVPVKVRATGPSTFTCLFLVCFTAFFWCVSLPFTCLFLVCFTAFSWCVSLLSGVPQNGGVFSSSRACSGSGR